MTNSLSSICWDVDPEVTIDAITGWCLAERRVDRMFVVARPDNEKPGCLSEPRVQDAVARLFGRKVLRTLWATAWAGTKLFRRRSAKIWVIEFDETVRQRMMAAENSLRGWVNSSDRQLPEDICLYRSGDRLPTFISVTHEPEAWLLDPNATTAPFAERAMRPLPVELIPPPPDFVVPG